MMEKLIENFKFKKLGLSKHWNKARSIQIIPAVRYYIHTWYLGSDMKVKWTTVCRTGYELSEMMAVEKLQWRHHAVDFGNCICKNNCHSV